MCYTTPRKQTKPTTLTTQTALTNVRRQTLADTFNFGTTLILKTPHTISCGSSPTRTTALVRFHYEPTSRTAATRTIRSLPTVQLRPTHHILFQHDEAIAAPLSERPQRHHHHHCRRLAFTLAAPIRACGCRFGDTPVLPPFSSSVLPASSRSDTAIFDPTPFALRVTRGSTRVQPSMTTSQGANDPMARRSSFKMASFIRIWSAACRSRGEKARRRKDRVPREDDGERSDRQRWGVGSNKRVGNGNGSATGNGLETATDSQR